AILTGCCGPSSSPRFASPGGLPISNVPPGIGSISNFPSAPGMASVYGFIDSAVSAGAWAGATCAISLGPPPIAQKAAARPIACEKRITFGMLQVGLEYRWKGRMPLGHPGGIMGATFAAWLLAPSMLYG